MLYYFVPLILIAHRWCNSSVWLGTRLFENGKRWIPGNVPPRSDGFPEISPDLSLSVLFCLGGQARAESQTLFRAYVPLRAALHHWASLIVSVWELGSWSPLCYLGLSSGVGRGPGFLCLWARVAGVRSMEHWTLAPPVSRLAVTPAVSLFWWCCADTV